MYPVPVPTLLYQCRSALRRTDPPTATGIWVALEDATRENGDVPCCDVCCTVGTCDGALPVARGLRNGARLKDHSCRTGCLWTWPGSHKPGVSRRFKRKQDDSVWFDGEQTQYDLQKFVPLEVRTARAEQETDRAACGVSKYSMPCFLPGL
jgi:Phytanoyl-CoA dioxygenase (PhyH)